MSGEFNPRKAGWETCPKCKGVGFWLIGKTHIERKMVLFERRSDWVERGDCPACDGLGIVVGPPADGIKMTEWATTWRQRNEFPFEHGVHMRWLVKQANAYKPTDG